MGLRVPGSTAVQRCTVLSRPQRGRTGQAYVTWITLLSDLMDGDQDLGPELFGISNPFTFNDARRNRSAGYFDCPEVIDAEGSSLVDYGVNATAMPNFFLELRGINASGGGTTSGVLPSCRLQ